MNNILTIKFETVDGKKTGKTFSFEMAETHPSHYDLLRFLDAQEFAYIQALRELKKGRKRGHWIWYIFPQQKGLGHSHNSNYYGLDGEGEARAYMEHPVLGDRLRECCKALLLHKDKDIKYIMGSGVDVLKLNTSMNLFCPHISSLLFYVQECEKDRKPFLNKLYL